MMSATISPHADALSSNQLIAPYMRVAGVMVDVDREVALEAGHAGPRQVAALEHDQRVEVALDARRHLDRGDAGQAPGTAGGGASRLTIRTVLPIARSAAARATCDPIESPSGRACDVRRNVERARIASRIRRRMSMARQGYSSRAASASLRSLGGRLGGSRRAGFGASARPGSPGAALRCAPAGRSTRRTGRPAPARGAGRAGAAICRRRNGLARSSALAVVRARWPRRRASCSRRAPPGGRRSPSRG